MLNQTNVNMDETNRMAALFDFDGVVADTEGQYTLFWNEQGRRYRPDISSFGNIIKGQTLTQIFDKYFGGQTDVQAVLDEALVRYEGEMCYDYVPGVTCFLADLRAHGVKTAIVTSSDDRKMRNVYHAHPELAGLVDCILTADLFTCSKPDPECFLLGASRLGVEPKECVVFEDSFHGLEAGRRAGMTVVGLSTTNPAEQIRDKAELVIPDFTNFGYEQMKRLLYKE